MGIEWKVRCDWLQVASVLSYSLRVLTFNFKLFSCKQRWTWVIFCDPWPMWPITQFTHDPHDPWPMAITLFHPARGTRRGRGMVVPRCRCKINTLHRGGTGQPFRSWKQTKLCIKIKPQTTIIWLIEWVSSFLTSTKNKQEACSSSANSAKRCKFRYALLGTIDIPGQVVYWSRRLGVSIDSSILNS